MSSITTKISHGITLGSGGYTSPLSITNTGGISNTGVALYSASGGTVTNSGTILSTSTYAVQGGINLTLTNAASGQITGYLAGVWAAAATLVNHGTITETAINGSAVYLANTTPDGIVSNYGLFSAVYRGIDFRGTGSLNNVGAIASTGRYGAFFDGAGSVTNSGSISGNNNGLVFLTGGSLTNTGGITGLNALALHGTGTINNSGTIDATYGTGVYLGQGKLSNASGGLITAAGYGAVYVASGAAAITNAGKIIGLTGITIATTNTANQTVFDTGTIAGTSGIAIALGSGNDLVQFNPSSSVAIQGTVNGGGGTNTLTFASAASSGTLTGTSAYFTNFGQASVASGAQWSLSGTVTLGAGVSLTAQGTLTVGGTVVNAGTMSASNGGIRLVGGTIIDKGAISGTAPLTFGTGTNRLTVAASAAAITGTIAGFTSVQDTIDLAGLSISSSTTIASLNTLTNVLTVTGATGSVQLQLDAENYSSVRFHTSNDGANGTAITPIIPVCFRAGTAIATPAGEKRVEDLAPGDLVLTANGDEKPEAVRWIGRRHVDCRHHPDTRKVWPVRIRAGAFGGGLPHRDLWLSPDHAVRVDDGLVPIKLLVNNALIQQIPMDEVTYYHIELTRHDVVLAEGLPAESYLDTGNRHTFENAGAPMLLHPFMDHAGEQARRAAGSCLPLICGAAEVEPIWRRLAAHAVAMGAPLPMAGADEDPLLCIRTGGRIFRPVSRRGQQYLFAIPRLRKDARILSRDAVPADVKPWTGDGRQLGVAINRITIRGPRDHINIALDDPRLTDGWWAPEPQDVSVSRWTHGDAVLPFEGDRVIVEISVCGTLPYRLDTARHAA